MRARHRPLAALSALALAVACSSGPPPAAPEPVVASDSAQAFDPERALAHVAALAEIGPRPMGSEGAAKAREYIRGELARLGLETREQRVRMKLGEGEERIEIHNLGAVIPGESPDLFLLLAPYDTRIAAPPGFVGANEASGAAVLLEVARVLAARPLAYTTWVIFLEGEAPAGPGAAGASRALAGSHALAQRLVRRETSEQIRLALVTEGVCDPDLRIARDLRSHRVYREEFWRAARRLGHTQAFPPDAGFESANASHRSLRDAGVTRVVALVDTSFGGDEPPGPYAGTADDDLAHCSAASLGIVGAVVLEGLGDISKRLAKIDRFADSPVAATEALRLEQLETESDAPDRAEAPAEGNAPDAGAEPAPEPTPDAAGSNSAAGAR